MVRRSVPLAAIPPLGLALLLLLPSVAAQDLSETHILDDPAGDTGAGQPTGRSGPYDLLGLDAVEGTTDIEVRLALGAVESNPPAPMADGVVYEVHFSYGGVAYLVRIVAGASLAGPAYGSLLADSTGGTEYGLVGALDVRADPVGRTYTAVVPRNILVDQAGAPSFAGQELTGFWATATSLASPTTVTGSLGGLASLGDRAPDTDVAAAVVTLRHGVQQLGHARLSSPEPFRASNGEAATFRFLLDAENQAARDDYFSLRVERAPPGWRVRLPEQDVQVPAGSAVRLEALAEVPFAHDHGRIATFTLALASRSDASSVGRVQLGILYTEPAQPAGHHDTLTLHSRAAPGAAKAVALALGSAGGGVEPYMNTFVDDPADDGVDVPPQYQGIADVDAQASFTWMVPLRPGLALGLDMDLQRRGEAIIPFAAPAPMPAAVLTGAVRLLGNETPAPGAGVELARLAAGAPVEVGAAAIGTLAAVVEPLPAGDYVPHLLGQDLWLEITLTYARPDLATGPATPMLKPGGQLRLPLVDYADHAVGAGTSGTASTAPDGLAQGEPGGEAATADGDPDGDKPARDAPAPPAAAGLLALAALAGARRRRAP